MNSQIHCNTTQRRLLADVLTPVGIYLRLRDQFPGSILLESNEYGNRHNSLSFICCEVVGEFKVQDGVITSQHPGREVSISSITDHDTMLKQLREYAAAYPQGESRGHPVNGLFGHMNYDSVPYVEQITLNREKPGAGLADLHYRAYGFVIVFDHYHDTIYVYHHDYGQQGMSLDGLVGLIEHRDVAQYPFGLVGEESSDQTDAQYEQNVVDCIAHCQRGDVFQIVPSRQFTQPYHGDEFQVYRQLRTVNPSPYLFYFDYGEYSIFGSSPEAQLIVTQDRATIQPIAGTYKRTGNTEADIAAAAELKKDPKETAEHVMLVDLARNDLSRHARNVRQTASQEIHMYSHVIHMVSTVQGDLATEEDRWAMIGDTFPAGTLTGAPKHNAMQLIDTYEPTQRGFYGGAIGILGLDGTYNHAILIRSFLARNNELTYRAGAGVVVHSSPASERQEVDNKIGALRRALQQTHSYCNPSQS